MKTLLVAVSALLLLSACTGGHPPRHVSYGPPTPLQPELVPTPEPPHEALPSRPPPVASAGPLKTAMIGKYMDNQEGDLRKALRGSAILVARRGDDITLVARTDELFATGTKLSDDGLRILWALAPVLRHYDHTSIFIAGYTDTTGSDEQNMAVSRKRAYTVGGALVKDGVSLSRLHAQGFGETDLKVPTGDNVNEPRNRRVEIHITAQASG